MGRVKERNEIEVHGNGLEGVECTSQLPSLFVQKETCEQMGILIILESITSLPSTRYNYQGVAFPEENVSNRGASL